MIALGIVFVVNAVQDMGQLEASANGAFDRNASFQEISGGVIANNIASMIGGFWEVLRLRPQDRMSVSLPQPK